MGGVGNKDLIIQVSGDAPGSPVSTSVFPDFANQSIEQIVVTDTVPLRPGAPDNVVVLSVAGLLADSITQIFTGGSLSRVFSGDNLLF